MNNPFSQKIEFSMKLFVGREREIWGTLNRLATPHNRGSSAVHGEGGIGKSWFLERLQQLDLLAEWELEEPNATVISLDCGKINPWSANAFWQAILQKLKAKNIPNSELDIIQDILSSSITDSWLIGRLLDQIAKNDRFLILILDDFERVIEQLEPENPSFLNIMRSFLVREHKGLGIVLATGESLTDLCTSRFHFDISPFDNVFYPVELRAFSQEETEGFIEIRLRDTGIHFTTEEKQRLFQDSQGHPERLREECFKLYADKSG